MKEDSTFLSVNGDSSYVYNTFICAPSQGAVHSVTIITSEYKNAQWVIVKDTSYMCGQVSAMTHSNIPYAICKFSSREFKICMDRLYFKSRQRFDFYIRDMNNVLVSRSLFF
jgi:hypothetical protein